MGLIRWIKDIYYNNRLDKADELVAYNDYDKAENIYISLLDKHYLAAPHLANLYSTSAKTVQDVIKAIEAISQLKVYTNEDNTDLYNHELDSHLSKVLNLSSAKFNEKSYNEAVALIDAVVPFRRGDKSIIERSHRCHAFFAFTFLESRENFSQFVTQVKHHLSLCGATFSLDIIYFINTLANKSLFYRAIKLIEDFSDSHPDLYGRAVSFLIDVVQGKDTDIPNPELLSQVCTNNNICKETANRLRTLSREKINRGDFISAISYDKYAAEFLSYDNSFNYERCLHIIRELEPRQEAREIAALLNLATELALTNDQIAHITELIKQIAQNCSPQKAIKICRLFTGNTPFDSIYINSARELAVSNPSAINKRELLRIIKSNTNDDTFADALSPFVQHIPLYGEIFVDSAITLILRREDVSLFERYWQVKEDASFFSRLICPSSNITKNVIELAVENINCYLNSDSALHSFLEAIDSLNDLDYAYNIAERLVHKKLNVLQYYIDKANEKCNNLTDEESIGIIDHTLSVIDFSHIQQSTWIPLYIRKRKIQEKGISAISQKTSFYKESIDTIINSSTDFSAISEPSYFELWQDYTSIVIKRSESQPKEKAITDLTEVRTQVESNCKTYLTYTSLCDALTSRIVKLRWETAKELEEYSDFDKAMEQYKSTVREGSSSYSTKADFRFLICAIKANKLTEEIEDNIKIALGRTSYQSLKDDLAYRYACLLLKTTRPSDAEYIIKTYLPTESQLLNICQNLYIKESEKYLEDFNSKCKSIAKEDLPLQEAIAFLNQFSQYKHMISRNLQDTTNKFIGYRRKLEAYIVKSFFDDEKYSDAFSLLLKIFPNFFEDDTNFRNVAIASLGIIESDENNINEDLRKKAISIWLSAIYNDRLFVKSLDYTSWDDQFTFTLEGSLGDTSYEDYDELPENINFDAPFDNQNIAIVDSQNSLISRAEGIIRDKLPDLERFFNQEKEALDALVSLNMDESCIIASPYFANMFQRILESIKDAMDTELTRGYGNDEDVISLGVKYGFGGGDYERYKKAFKCAEACRNAYGKPASTLKSALSTLPKIKEFDKLYSSLKSFFSNKMNDAIKEEMHYSTFIDTFAVVCSAFNDTALSLGFSQYANGEVVHLLNEDTMHERDGAMLLARIYNIAPSNIQVKQNLEGVLKALARITVEKNQRADVAALNRALEMVGEPFKKAVNVTLIVQKVKNDKISHKTALTELYNIYVQDKNDEGVCESLVSLCDICIWRCIIGDTYDSYSVQTMLDKIYNNTSTTFKNKSSVFAVSFLKIMKELSNDNRMSILLGINLNSKGQALRKGLKYFVKFSPNGDLPSELTSLLRQ